MPLCSSSVSILIATYKNFCVVVFIIGAVIVLSTRKAYHRNAVIDIIGRGIDVAILTCCLRSNGIGECSCCIL